MVPLPLQSADILDIDWAEHEPWIFEYLLRYLLKQGQVIVQLVSFRWRRISAEDGR